MMRRLLPSVCLLLCLLPMASHRIGIAQSKALKQQSALTGSLSEGFFYEDFSSSSLAPGWSWIREDPDNWSLTERPGYLRINTQWGTIYEDEIGYNLLLRAAPTSSYQLSTRVEIDPTEDHHEAALFLYQDDDHYIVINRLYHSDYGGDVYGFGREGGGASAEGFLAAASEAVTELRLTVTHSVVVGEYRDDAGQWQVLGAIEIDALSNYPRIAIVAYHGCLEDQPVSIPADFDFVKAVPVSSPMGLTERVSVSSDGVEGDGASLSPDISMDGRYVSFFSAAGNLVANDSNSTWDGLVHDRQTGSTTLVSVSSDGTQSNGESKWAAVSGDGRYVVFDSLGDNLVGDDTNGVEDVFVYDREGETTERVSVSSNGTQGSDRSWWSHFSADGRWAVFDSLADNLVDDDTNGWRDVFVHDLLTRETERASIGSGAVQGNNESLWASISGDGRLVAFCSLADNLVLPDGGGYYDVFVHDRQTGITERISTGLDGLEANGDSHAPRISADGRYVAFDSLASNLIPDDTNGMADVFVYDRNLHATERISVGHDGSQADGPSSWPYISGDGRYVVLASAATNLVPDDTNAAWDVFLYDRLLGYTERVSVSSTGEQGNGDSGGDGVEYSMHNSYSMVTDDGRFVAFHSIASNLVDDDTNDTWDTFVRDRRATMAQPIVLVHGWKGMPRNETRSCDEWIGRAGQPGVVVDTFGAMAGWFQELGYDVWVAHLDSGPEWGGTPPIEENAQCLRAQVAHVRQETGQDVILIAHSMGGLVSRACLSFNDCRDNVDALYTLGSPHAGINTAFLVKLLARLKAPIAETAVCAWQPAACQFSTEGVVWFNLSNPSRDLIDYGFIGGTKTPLRWGLGLLLLALEGPHDGVVGGHSAVGWLWPTQLNVVPGPEAERFWTDETHSDSIGSPSYFEPSGGTESQAFHCIVGQLDEHSSADCRDAGTEALGVREPEPVLTAVTADIVGHVASGQSADHLLQIDTTDHSLVYLSWLTGTLTLTLTQPDGQVITPAYAEAHSDVVTYTTSLEGDVVPPFAAYAFATTVPGPHTLTVTAEDVGTEGADYVAFAALETDRTLSVTTDTGLYQVGDTATFTATLEKTAGGIAGADVGVLLTSMDGVTETLVLADLGNGTYRTTYTIPDAPGYLQAAFAAVGVDGAAAFSRQVDKLLLISSHAAQLSDDYADWAEDSDGDGFNDTLALDVGLVVSEAGGFILAADLVAYGQVVARATEYVVLAEGTQVVTLRFDGWDIRRSRLDGPYEVTPVHLTDVSAGSVPAQYADNVWVTASYQWHDFGFESLYLPLVLRAL